MTDHFTGPALSVGSRRRTILLTGGSGVVGRALLNQLGDFDVVCLVHNTPISEPGVRSIRGDVSQPNLGLPEGNYTDLCRRVDAVIHCAAITEFNRTDGSLEATNIGGTENVLAFAEAAGTVLYHVSTAYVNTAVTGERGHTAIGYAASKSAAEKAIANSGVRHVILRPSVVIGDSETGEIAAFQGLHQVAAGVFAGIVPMIPFDPSWPIDFVPCDVVASAIVTAVENELSAGEFWITAGDQALRLEDAMQVCVELAHELGVEIDMPRFVPPEMFDRLIGPVFLDVLPPKIKKNVLRMLEFFATYLQAGSAKPSSMDELAAMGAKQLGDQHQNLRSSLLYWAEEKGYAARPAVAEVA
jgi:nucleoside-diphosphate-sugar epimerase